MRHINWDNIQERQAGEYPRPEPGGYAAVICSVDDAEDKERLEIWWDFAEGPFRGSNQETFRRAGFWPIRMIQSYKEKALPFLKTFKTAVEASNPGYVFREQDVQGLRDKRIGVVLGEEEYEKRDGTIGVRLYVFQVRSLQAVREGDFKIPERKYLRKNAPPAWGGGRPVNVTADDFQDLGTDGGKFPF